jgi:hypothetical protein
MLCFCLRITASMPTMMTSKAFSRIDEPEQIEVLLTGIAFQCPFGSYRRECVLGEYRGLPVRKWLDRLAELTPAQKRDLYHQHLSCLEQRESGEAA